MAAKIDAQAVPPVPSGLSNPPGSGWQRDLMRECVEPNPGPSWEDVKDALNKKLGEKGSARYKDKIDRLADELNSKYDDAPNDRDIHQYIVTNEFKKIFEENADKIRDFIYEIIPIAQVQVPFGSADSIGAETVADRIGRVLGNPLKDQDILILHQNFGAYVSLYEKKDPSVADARKLMGLIAAVIRSQTVRDLHQQGYLFNGIVGGAGSGRSTIYSVYQISTRTAMAAKVYTSEMFQDAALELKISEEIKNSKHIHARQIIQYTESFEFSHHDHQGPLKALIMLRFHDSLQNFLSALVQDPFDEIASSELARVLLQVGCVFLTLRKAHSDIKPNNIMITNGSFKIIDLGSTTEFGKPAKELTPRFHLDANVHNVDHKLDLYCIATTLALCAGVKDNADKPLTSLSCTTAATLRSLLAPCPHKAAKIAVLCLNPTPSFNCENALQAATLAGFINV